MPDKRPSAGPRPPLRFAKTTGTPVTGRYTTKQDRIVEAANDLQLVLSGLAAEWERSSKERVPGQNVASLARACSIFLRKLVIGDRGGPKTRLLNDDVCKTMQMGFCTLRRIPVPRRQLELGMSIEGGHMTLTKLDDDTLVPQHVYHVPIAPHRLKVTIEWPLPGAASWTEAPTHKEPWTVRPEELFDTECSKPLDCSRWLGQQVVMFDNKGVILKDIIRTVVNFEGAHSINISRLNRAHDERDTDVTKNPERHILDNLTVCGIRYTHMIVIESAFYLLDKLLNADVLDLSSGSVRRVIPSFVPQEPFGNHRGWLALQGGLMLSLGDSPRNISHRIRAVRL